MVTDPLGVGRVWVGTGVLVFMSVWWNVQRSPRGGVGCRLAGKWSPGDGVGCGLAGKPVSPDIHPPPSG